MGKGALQAEYLKALDFMDSIAPRLRYFNVCRAKTGYDPTSGCSKDCDYALPDTMWRQASYKCQFK